MKVVSGVVVLILTALVSALPQEAQRSTGEIHGVVLDEKGQPLVGAKVTWWRIGGPPASSELVEYVDTDGQGRFNIGRVPWGRYGIAAIKEEDGYPDFADNVYGDGRSFTATLSPENPRATVLVTTGKKAGSITGEIVDAETGKPIPNAGMHMWHWNEPARSRGGTIHPQYRLLAPADIEVGLEITADGYETWIYPGDAIFPQGKPLVLKSGERLNLDIRLQPKSR